MPPYSVLSPWQQRAPYITIIGSVVGILGLVFGAWYIPMTANKMVYDQVIVDSQVSKGFEGLTTNLVDGQPQLYNKAYLFSLTNMDELVSSKGTAKPSFKEMGPYVWRQIHNLTDPRFIDTGEKVYGYDSKTYVYEPSLSCEGCDPEHDKVHQFNHLYLAGLAALHSVDMKEDDMSTVLLGPGVAYWMDFASTMMTQYIIANRTVIPLWERAQTLANRTQGGWQGFCEIWSAAPSAKDTLWNNMILAPFGAHHVSVATCEDLFSLSHTHSLVNAHADSLDIWTKAVLRDEETLGDLEKEFGLSSRGLEVVLDWLHDFQQHLVIPLVLNTYSITHIEELTYVQWIFKSVFPQGLHDAFPDDAPFDCDVELKEYLDSIPSWLIPSRVRSLLSPPGACGEGECKDMLNPIQIAQLEKDIGVKDTYVRDTALMNDFGLTFDEAQLLMGYFMALMSPWGGGCNAGELVLNKYTSEGGGLFMDRTPNQIMIHCTDMLAALLLPGVNCALLTNITSAEEAPKHGNVIGYDSGRTNHSLIQNQYLYENQSVIQGMWAEDMVVWGQAGTQYPPGGLFGKSGEEHFIFSDVLVRTLRVIPDKNVKISKSKLDATRFLEDPTTMDPDPFYYQSVKGFANMSTALFGAPVFLGLPHMLNTPEKWRNKVVGQNPVAETHQPFIDVEPITGKVINGAKRFQANFWMPSDVVKVWGLNQEHAAWMPNDLVWPFAWFEEVSVIAEDQAKDFRNTIYAARGWALALAWCGGILLVGSILVGALLRWGDKWPKVKYTRLNSLSGPPPKIAEEEEEEPETDASSETEGLV